MAGLSKRANEEKLTMQLEAAHKTIIRQESGLVVAYDKINKLREKVQQLKEALDLAASCNKINQSEG